MTPAARRLAFAVPAIIVAALLCADAVTWRIATDLLLAAYTRWQADLPAHGWQASSDPPTRTGFPLAATLRLTGASLTQPGGVRLAGRECGGRRLVAASDRARDPPHRHAIARSTPDTAR